jgi:hypothetical protein
MSEETDASSQRTVFLEYLEHERGDSKLFGDAYNDLLTDTNPYPRRTASALIMIYYGT